MRRLRSALCLLLLLSAFAAARAQTATTSLRGVVADPSGAVVSGAEILLTEPSTGFSQAHKSNAQGEYSFQQIPPGSYQVTISAPGFDTEITHVTLLVNQPGTVNAALAVGSSNTDVQVTAEANTINVTDASLGSAFNPQQVANLPYLANNVTYLLSLQPGVLALDSGAQSGGLNTDTRTGIVNGARQDQSNISLDGVDNNDQIFGYAFLGALRSTRDSVEEFRVTTTNANADEGRSSGAQVNLVTKSGTNTIHGSAYEYYRDPATTSNNWFIKQGQLTSGEPNIAAKVLEHTYGASLGLPIKKDKLFFFGAYEGFRQASDIPVGEVVPSTVGGGGLVTGNVTYQAADGSYKTVTPSEIASMDGRYNGSDKTCLKPGVTCYAPQTDAAAVQLFQQYPIANAPGGDFYNTGSFNFTSPAPVDQITNIARIDYNISPRQTLFVRGNLQSDNQQTSLQFPGLPPAASIYGNNKGIAAGHTWSINDHLTNNARYGFTRTGNATRGSGSQPYTNFLAFDTLTATTTSTIYQVATNDFSDDLTYTKGRHTFQGGVDVRLVSNGEYFDRPEVPVSYVSPNLLSTAAIAGQGGSLDPGAFANTPGCPDCEAVSSAGASNYNAAIIANVGAIEESTSGTEFQVKGNTLVPLAQGVLPTHTFKNVEQEYYFQDQWKATPQLTLTFGIRYVYLGVPYEENGQQIAPTISANTFLANRIAAAAAGTGYDTDVSFRASGSVNGQPNFWTPQKGDFAPRLAFAYATSDGKSSIRGGFALAYDHFGAGIIDAYQSNSSSLFSLAQTNKSIFEDINTNPRFTNYRDIPPAPGATAPVALPYTPAEQPFSFDFSINEKQKTPYAETFNLTVQHELPKNLNFTASYVGRLGRHLIQNLDVAMPTNTYDPISGQSYFQAATAYDKMVDAGVDPSTVPDSGYFHNLFPNFAFEYQPASGNTPALYYYGAQAYYANFAANRGNETNTLFEADTDPKASPGGQSFRFFFPQTSSIFVQSTTGVSSYNALQLSIHQTLRYGLDYAVNYTYSKSLDEGSDPERNGAEGGSSILNSFAPHQWYANSDFDVRHNVTADYTAPLPFGKGSPFLNRGGLVDRILGGYQLNGVVHYSTGFPFSAVAANVWGTNFADNSNMVQIGKIPTGGHHYAASIQEELALKGITSAQALANLRFPYVGESGQRNNFRSDGYFSLDDGLAKSFHTIREQQFRVSVEVFNVLNTNRFATVNTQGDNPNFGQYINGTSQYQNGAVQSGTNALLLQPRQMQFSGKYIF
jgi:hypothetical protein